MKLERVYYETEQEALDAELVYTNRYKDDWTDGITIRWCEPQFDEELNKWWILAKRGMSLIK
jgi:hypothetical protein